jgi:hypothetical protein
MPRKLPVVGFLLFAALLARTQTTTQALGNYGIVGTVLNEEGQLVEHNREQEAVALAREIGGPVSDREGDVSPVIRLDRLLELKK